MKQIIHSNNAPEAIGSYSQAVEANNTLYISGQIAINPRTGKLADAGIEEQTELVLKNIGAILQEDGYSYCKIDMPAQRYG